MNKKQRRDLLLAIGILVGFFIVMSLIGWLT